MNDAGLRSEIIGRMQVPLAPTAEASPDKVSVIWFDDAQPMLDGQSLVSGLLEAATLTLCYGEPGCGKTFFILDLALHIAAGRHWRGQQVQKGVVLYVAAEAGRSVVNRSVAWRNHYVVSTADFAIRLGPIDLLNNSDDEALFKLIKEIELVRGPVRLVVIDTLSRAMPGGDENTSTDMTRFVAACDRIRAATGATVLLVHHKGKDSAKGARGHSSLRAAVDTEFEITKDTVTGLSIVRVTKQRDGVEGANFGFRLVSIPLGINDRGQSIEAGVAVPEEVSGDRGAATKLTPRQAGIVSALKVAVASHGVQPAASTGIPEGAKVLTLEMAVDFGARAVVIEDKQRRRDEAKRQLQKLAEKKVIGIWDGWVWLCS